MCFNKTIETQFQITAKESLEPIPSSEFIEEINWDILVPCAVIHYFQMTVVSIKYQILQSLMNFF